MNQSYEFGLYVFMLAAFLGWELVKRVSPLLHTPLMSLSNAISAIAVVGAIALALVERFILGLGVTALVLC